MHPCFRLMLSAIPLVGIAACGDTPTEPVKPTQVTFNVCGSALPWVGYQDGDGEWIEVEGVPTGTAHSYTFTMTQRAGGVAYVMTTTCGRYTWVVYGSADELATWSSGECGSQPANTKTVHGTLAGGVNGRYSTVSLGLAYASVVGESGSFTLNRVAGGPQDLVALRGNAGGADKVILRRRVDFPNGDTIPPLDFAGSEAFALDSAQLSIQQLAAPGWVSSTIYLADGRQFSTYSGSANATSWYRGFPASATIAGDMHGIGVTSAGRSVGTFVGPLANHTVSLGPAAAAPTVTALSTGAPLRRRLTIPVQSEYSKTAHARFESGTRPYYYLFMTMTAGYRRSAQSWVLEVPTFGASSGYDPAWALQPSSREIWSSTVYDYDVFRKFVPAIGLTRRSASASSSSAALSVHPLLDKSGGQQLAIPTPIDARYVEQSCSL